MSASRSALILVTCAHWQLFSAAWRKHSSAQPWGCAAICLSAALFISICSLLTASCAAVQTINQLLSEMDGFEGNTGVIVVAATNRPDVRPLCLLRCPCLCP